MKIYTRTGDDGTTGLFGGGRVGKDHPRIQAYGTVDETNSVLGLAQAFLHGLAGSEAASEIIGHIQNDLFVVGADLATPVNAKPTVPRITSEQLGWLEETIDRLDGQLPPLEQFILPGGTAAASALHVARTVCRRAERLVVEAGEREPLNELVVPYLNRLSDLLFVLARYVNQAAGVADVAWSPRAPRSAPERRD